MAGSKEDADSSILIAYYKQQFTEIYHLDTLDWRVALILFPTFGGFFGVLGYLYTISPTTNSLLSLGFGAFRAFSFFLLFLAFYGMWTVARGQVWLRIRTALIRKIERQMKVNAIWESVFNDQSRWKEKVFRRIPLYAIYSVLFYFSLTVVLSNSITDWKIINSCGIGWTLVVSFICAFINCLWLKSTLKTPQYSAFPKKS